MNVTKFCIITTARCGSNALVSLLRLMPNTICHSEIFSHTGVWLTGKPSRDLTRSIAERDLDPVSFLREVEQETLRHADRFGFKLFIGHNRSVLQHVIRSAEYRIILLSRQNSLAQFASLEVARASGLWQSHRKAEQRPVAPAIRFDKAEFHRFAKGVRWQYKRLKSKLEAHGHPYFPIEYKQLKNGRTVDALGEFLGGTGAGALSQLIPSIPEVKQSTVAIPERFSNPEDVVAAMHELGHEDWLIEEDGTQMSSVLALAGEVCSHPAMLRDWAIEFGDDPRVGLTICARHGDAAQLHSKLDQAFAELEPAVSSRRRHIREVVAPVAGPVEQSLIEGAVAYYSFRKRPAFNRLPRIGRGDFGALRAICGTFKDACEDPVGPPDFIGVAAQKSGTSWWCELIYRHPRVHRSRRFGKEARFFSAFRGFPPDSVPVERYASLFPRPAGTIIGEWTPDYLWDPGCAAMLKHAAPEARILVLLRDPVERYISGVTHRVMYGEPMSPGADQRMAFEAGLYARQLETLLEFFPREQVLVLQYERCCLDPAGQLERTYRFLGLDPGFVPEGLTVPIHATRIDKVQVPDETRHELVQAYRADGARLAELFPDLDLGLWTSLRTEQTESTT